MKRLFWVILICISLVNISLAAPEPAVVPDADIWTVDVSYENPRQIMVQVDGRAKLYWYVILTVTNNSGQDVDFYPRCEVMTDTFKIAPASVGIAPIVFQSIKMRHQTLYPFLEPLDSCGNRILQGKDNTKDIAIIWPDFDPQAKGMNLFIAGLSNEAVAINHPVEKDEEGRPIKVFLRKTLELSYSLGGDPAFRTNVQLTPKGKYWIMR